MKKIFFWIYLILLTTDQFILSQQAKDNYEEVFLQQLETSEPVLQLENESDFYNAAHIQQVGNNNNASINQTLTGTNTKGNVAELIQNGDINTAVLYQSGNRNRHYINQNGNLNIFEGSVTGNNNSSLINQIGSDNLVNQKLSGNDMTFILSQFGNNNKIVQVENNQSSQKYEIIQNGNGMQLVIINGGTLP